MNEQEFNKVAIQLAHAIIEKWRALAAWEEYGETDEKEWRAERDDALFDVYHRKILQITDLEKTLRKMAGV